MYNLKKVIASICVIAMMLTTVALGATYTDVAEDSAYYEAVETLNKLEIVTGYEDGTYRPEAGVTRAEMAALIARIQGYGDTAAGSASTGFADVPASHWASGYIANAAGMGIINGYGDGNFGPEDPVLYEQAVKMVMATLGYTPYAENNGGYPGGYLAAAQRYDVVAGVSNATMGTEANRGTIAQLLVNAIDTPLMAQKTWATDGTAEYVIYDGEDYALKTLMSVNLGYVKLRGVVTENAYTALDAAKTIDVSEDETVVINITDTFDTANKDFPEDEYGNYIGAIDTFLVGETDAADFLGMSVLVYVKKLDSNDYEIVSIAADTARNKTLSIDLTQFSQINGTTGKFEYFKTADAKTATAVVVTGADVVYNNDGGFVVGDIFGDEVANNGATLDGGKITLIDNDTTNGYDVIFVEIAETAVVDEAEEGFVAFKEATSLNSIMDLVIDEDAEDEVIVITKDGEAVAAADLAEWDVLSIIANGDGSYITAEVISNSIVGTIKSVANSDSSAHVVAGKGKAYTIENTKYDVAAGAYGMSDLAIGAGGTFYINKYGKIAAFNEDAALASGVAANYAYVTAATLDADVLTGANTAIVQMVTAEGLVVLNVKATNAKINGVAFDADAAGAAATLDALEGTVVKYTKNSNDLITAITSADVEDDFVSVAGASTKTYDAENGKFVSGHYIDADALVFFIAAEAEDSYLGSVADLEDETPYDIYAIYADDKADDNNILVVAGGAGSISPKASMGVLTAIGTSENEDGEAIYAVEVLVNGEVIAAETTADAKSAADGDGDLTVGDIVKVKVGSDGLISKIEFVYDFVDGVRDFSGTIAEMDVTAIEGTAGANEAYVGGKVTSYKKSSTLANVDGATIKLSQAQNVIVIDANGRELEIKKSSASNFKAYEALYDATLADVNVTINKVDKGSMALAEAQKAADYVYARVYDGKVADLVIVKGVDALTVRNGATVAVSAAIATSELYGKAASALGEFSISANSTTFTVTGTANYISDYTGYDPAHPAGNFVPVKFTGLRGATVIITKNGGTPKDVSAAVASDDVLELVVGLDGETTVELDVDGTVYTVVFDVTATPAP